MEDPCVTNGRTMCHNEVCKGVLDNKAITVVTLMDTFHKGLIFGRQDKGGYHRFFLEAHGGCPVLILFSLSSLPLPPSLSCDVKHAMAQKLSFALFSFMLSTKFMCDSFSALAIASSQNLTASHHCRERGDEREKRKETRGERMTFLVFKSTGFDWTTLTGAA